MSPDDTIALREAYEERAGIMEYDGGYTRQEAEREARRIVYGTTRENGAQDETS